MNYELAKKLKDAGFPILGRGEFLEGEVESDECGIITNNSVYIPTLPELIEACGDRFDALIKNEEGAGYMATGAGEVYFEQLLIGDGKTPEEAVANLWLELNKKNNE